MAVQTIYILAQAGVTPNFFGPTQLNGSAPTGANTAYGWAPARVSVATPYYRGRLGATTTSTDTAAASSYNAGTTGPTKGTGTGATTAGDSFIAGPFTGTFAATAWTFDWNLRAVTAGCVGHVNMRVWKSANADGSSATQLLANTAGLTVTLSSSADVNSSISWSPGSLTLNNEYLFFQVEWQETTQGANPINDVFFRAGTSSITTADFNTTWGDHGSYITLSNGNLDATNISTGNNRSTVRANTPHNVGLWYCEVEILAGTNYAYTAFGACDDTSQAALLNTDSGTPAYAGGTRTDGTGYYNGFTSQAGTPIPSANVGDRIQIAVDCTHQGLYLGTNNTWTTGSNPSTLTNPRFTWTTLPGINVYPWVDTIQGNVVRIHPDAATQIYAPPTGFQPWSAADNLSSHKLVRSFTLSNERNNFTGWVGVSFTAGTDRTYNKIGLYCGAGSTGIHNVRLYTGLSSTPTLIQSWTIDLTGSTPGSSAYAVIPQVTLTAGVTYTIAEQVTNGDGQFWAETSPSTLRGANTVSSIYSSDGTNFTGIGSGGNSQYGGVDLDVTYSGPPVGLLSINQANQTLSATGTVPLAVRTARLGGSPTIFLCHADSFADDSFYQHGLIASSDVQITTSSPAPKFGTGSFLLNVGYITSDRVEDYWFDTGPFTVEAWCYFTTLQNYNNSIAGNWASSAGQRGWLWTVDNSAGNIIHFSTDGSNSFGYGNSPAQLTYINYNTWQHFVCERDAVGKVRFYVNGVVVYTGSGLNYSLYHSPVSFTLASFSFPGYLDEIRVSKIARYATDTGFTPPAAPFTVDYPNYTQPNQTLVATGVSLAPASATLGQPIQTKLLVHADGLNGSTTFTDDAGHTLTASNVTVRTAQTKFGTGSADFTASTSAYINTGNSTDFNFGAGQFTVEAWCYFTSAPTLAGATIFSQWSFNATNIGYSFYLDSTGLYFFLSTDGTNYGVFGNSYTPLLNTWTHIAVERDTGGTLRIYVNGAVNYSSSVGSTIYPSTQTGIIGNDHSLGSAFPGYLDEIRVTKGLARYRGPFTPSSSPYAIEFSGQQASQTVRANNFTPTTTPTVMLSASRAVARSVVSSQDVAARTVVLSDVGVSRQLAVGPPATATLGLVPIPSPSCVLLMHIDWWPPFIDSSSSAHTLTDNVMGLSSKGTGKFGDYAAYFLTPSSYIDTGNATDFNFGAGPFTIECWAYFTTTPAGFQMIASQMDFSVASNFGWAFYMASGNLTFLYSTTGSNTVAHGQPFTPTLNTWYHLAAEIDASGVLRTYVNGAVNSTNSLSPTIYPSTLTCLIGNDHSGSGYVFPGYLDEIRITKGRAMYGGAFTPPTQPFSASNTVLLVHADSVDGSGHWVDSSLNAAVMPSGGPVLLNTTTIKFGIGSANFSGGSNRFISTGGVTDFNFGAAPFTIEMWCYFNSLPGGGFVLASQWSSGNTGWELTTSGTSIVFNYYDGTTTRSPSAVFALSTGAWLHVAVDCDATNTMRFYVNGVVVGSAAIFRPIFPSTATCVIGNDFGFASAPNGYLDEIRVTKGVARFAGAFTPPTTAYPPDFVGITQASQTLVAYAGPPVTSTLGIPLFPSPSCVLLMHGDGTNGSTTFIDSSPSAHTFTSAFSVAITTTSPKFGTGSINFPNTSAYLDLGPSTDFDFGAGPFTIEAWCYFTSMPGPSGNVSMILAKWGASNGFIFNVTNTAIQFTYSTDGSNYTIVSATNTITLNTWVHIAIDRDASGVVRFYNNGAVLGSASIAVTIYPGTSNVQVGNGYGMVGGFAGNLDEIRVTNGRAMYQGAFTPQTQPFSVSNTVLLMHCDEALYFLDSSLSNNALIAVSPVNVSTTTTKFGARSADFTAGSTAAIDTGNISDFSFGALQFTVEMWCYFTTTAPARVLASQWGGTGQSWLIYCSNGGLNFAYSINGTTTTTITATGALTAGAWIHVAVDRDASNTFRMYVNGMVVSSTTVSATFYPGHTNCVIGNEPGQILGFSGYLDEVRVSKGVARFAGAFTPPTTAYPPDFTVGLTQADQTLSANGIVVSGPTAWFYRSLATGTGTGLNWTNARTSLTNMTSVSVGDPIWVADDHAETSASNLTVTLPGTIANPNIVVCVDHTVASPGSGDWRTSALVTTTAGGLTLAVNGSAYFYGIGFRAGSGATTSSTLAICNTAGWQSYDACSLQMLSTVNDTTGLIQIGDTTATKVILNNTKLQFSASAQTLSIKQGIVQWRNTANAIAGTPPGNLLSSFGAAYQLTCDGVDLGAVSGSTMVNSDNVPSRIYYNNCRFDPASTAFGISTLAADVFINDCDTGNSNYRQWRTNKLGFQRENTAIVRTGGASDGTTPISWLLDSSNFSRVNPFESLPIDLWNTTTGSPLTVTVRGIILGQNTLPDSSQIWMEAQYLGSASATLASFIHDGLSNWAAIPAVLVTADTSAWDSKITTRQNGFAYSISNLVKVASNPGRVFLCTGSGTSNATEPGAYATAVDGATVNDGTAVFRAGMRFKMSVILTPQLVGSIFVTVKVGDSSVNPYIDPLVSVS